MKQKRWKALPMLLMMIPAMLTALFNPYGLTDSVATIRPAGWALLPKSLGDEEVEAAMAKLAEMGAQRERTDGMPIRRATSSRRWWSLDRTLTGRPSTACRWGRSMPRGDASGWPRPTSCPARPRAWH